MPINIKCPECGDKRSVPDEFVGKKLKCKSCGAVFRADAPPPATETTRPSKRRDPDDEEADESPRSRRRDADDEQAESKSSRLRDRDEDEKPRSRHRGEDEDEEREKPRRRNRDEEDDEDEERPRRGKQGGTSRGKSKSKPKKKKITVGYIIGVILAFLFLLGALSFVGWRAGLFESKSKDKDRIDDEKEPEYVAPDRALAHGAKRRSGPMENESQQLND